MSDESVGEPCEVNGTSGQFAWFEVATNKYIMVCEVP
jgi:hypothetical protein